MALGWRWRYPEDDISYRSRNTPTFSLVFLQGTTTAPTPKFHRPLPSASVHIGIDFLCRTTNKNVSRTTYKVAQAPRSTVLVKLTVPQLVKNFTAYVYYRTQRFITSFTSTRHLSIPWSTSIQSIPPHPTYLRPIWILPSHQRLVFQMFCFLQVFPPKPHTNLISLYHCLPRTKASVWGPV
jgi:hypothetical protein